MIDITLTQEELRNLWGFWDDDAEPEDEAVRLMLGHGHNGHGLYAAAPEYPDEGTIFIKATPDQHREENEVGRLWGLVVIHAERNHHRFPGESDYDFIQRAISSRPTK